MKKSTLITLLCGGTLALAAQGAFAFYDPNLVPSGHAGAPHERTTQAARASAMSDAFAYLTKSGYAVQSLTLLPDGNYDAQVIGPDAKVKNVRVLLKQQQIVNAQGQAVAPIMSADEAIHWLTQMGYTPQSFQMKGGKYTFSANDKSGQAEHVTIDPATKDLSVVEAASLA